MSPLLSESSNDLLTLLHLYNSELSSVLDKHAPLKSRMATIRPAASWFSEEIKPERRVRRRLERRWRRTRLPEDRLRFIEQNRIVNELLLSVRSQYYTRLICYIGVLRRSIHLALPWRILQIDSLAFSVRRLLLFDMNWNRTLCRELTYLMKSQ